MRIWVGANNTADKISRIDLHITPLNKNSAEGMMESDKALNILFFFQQIIHSTQ